MNPWDRLKQAINLPANTVITGRVAVPTAGTAVQFSTTSRKIRGVFVSLDIGSTGLAVIGGANVNATNDSMQGFVITHGSTPVLVPVDDLNLLYVNVQNNGDAICFLAFLQEYFSSLFLAALMLMLLLIECWMKVALLGFPSR